MRRAARIPGEVIGATVAAIVVVLVWLVVVRLHAVSRFLVPSPGEVGRALTVIGTASGTYEAAWRTTWEVLLAFTVASMLGIGAGVAAGSRRLTLRAYEPMLGSLAAIPLVVLYPVFLAVLGVGSASKIAFGVTVAFFPAALAAINAAGAVKTSLLMAARSMGANTYQLYRRVIIPAAFPGIRTAFRMALVFSILAVVAGEFMGSSAGLGYLLATAGEAFKTPETYAYVIVTLVLIIFLQSVISGVVRVIERVTVQ